MQINSLRLCEDRVTGAMARQARWAEAVGFSTRTYIEFARG